MAAEKSPAFQFYAKEFLTDGNVMAMTMPERGVYITLICACWQEGSLPTETTRLAIMVGVPHKRFLKLWAHIAQCFVEHDARFIHPRLEKERVKQAAYRRRQSDAGKASRFAISGQFNGNRTTTVQPESQPEGNHGSTTTQPEAQPNGNQTATRGQPESNSPISDLRSPILKDQEHVRALSRAAPATPEREQFNQFWHCYPKKVGKDAAWKAWQVKHLSTELAATIIAALAWQVQQDNWLVEGGRFVPNPATWINQGRWQDEPNTTPRVNDRTLAAMAATRDFIES